MKSSATDLTKGSIIKVLLFFTIPIMVGNILQQMYNVADTAIIGNILGDNALAAVGAAAAIYELCISSAGGFANGFAVIIAQNFGAKREEELKKSIAWTYVLSISVAILITIIGLLGIRPLLKVLETPERIIDQTAAYMQIIILFYVVSIFYNMFAAMLRAIGNSRAPIYFLAIATVINIVLDYIFVKYWNMGVAGVACATGIAQLVSAISCALYIKFKCPILKFDRKNLKKDMGLVKDLFMTGLSMALMWVIVNIGSIALQPAINSLGERMIAGYSAARRIDSVLMMPIGAFNSACATFTSQNFGAGRIDRVKKGILASNLLCFIWNVFACIIAYAFGGLFVKLLTGTQDTLVLETAVRYIKINVPFFSALSVLIVLRSSLQGIGRKAAPLTTSVVELVAKFAAAGFVISVLGFIGICYLEPIIWVICAFVVLIDYLIFIRKCKKREEQYGI